MKTRIIIDIETKLNKIHPMDSITGEIDHETEVTATVDRNFHDYIETSIRDHIENKLEDDVMDWDFDYKVEEWDCFADYGQFDIKIITETKDNTLPKIPNKNFGCMTCWKKGQIQKDCPDCKGTGLTGSFEPLKKQDAYERFIEIEFPNYA